MLYVLFSNWPPRPRSAAARPRGCGATSKPRSPRETARRTTSGGRKMNKRSNCVDGILAVQNWIGLSFCRKALQRETEERVAGDEQIRDFFG